MTIEGVMRKKTRAHLWVLVPGLAAALGLGLVSIHVPFARDQGVAAYVAEVMARGGVVYRDVYHFNLPGIFFIYYLARFLPWPNPEAVNLLHLVFLGLTALAVYAAGRELFSAMASALAGVFYAAFAVVLYTDYWDIAQKESLAGLPLALALWSGLRSLRALAGEGEEPAFAPGASGAGPGLVMAGLAGFFSGAAAQMKPTLGIVLVAALYLAWQARSRKKVAWLVPVVSGAGFAASFLPLLVYLARHQALGPMVESVIRFGGFYGGLRYQGVSAAAVLAARKLAWWMYEWRFLTALALPGAVLAWRRGPAGRLVAVFGLLLLVQVIVQMKFFTYHWIPLLLPVSLLAGEGAVRLVALAESARGRMLRWSLAIVLVALFLGNLGEGARRYRREILYDLHWIDRTQFLAAYGRWGGGDICQVAAQAVARYLHERSRSDDPVLVLGHELFIYLLADRFPGTRFAYDQPLMTDPGHDPSVATYRQSLRAEFMRDLDRAPPLYIVVIENDQTGIESQDSFTQLKSFPELKQRIERDYQLETKIEDYYVYRRI